MLGLPLQGAIRGGGGAAGFGGHHGSLRGGNNGRDSPAPTRPRIGTVIESRYPGGGGVGGEGRGSGDGGSEERIVIPEGEIVKQTQILRHVSGESYRDGSLF